MNILSVDLGTTTGWATVTEDRLQLGSHRLATDAEVKQWCRQRLDRRLDPRPLRLYDFLAALPKPDLIVFEDVQFQTFTKQTQLWSSLRTAVWFLARDKKITCECVPVSVLKKFATGHGGATKGMMCSALCRRFPDRFAMHGKEAVLENHTASHAITQDDNAVDAAWLAMWAQHNLSRMKL